MDKINTKYFKKAKRIAKLLGLLPFVHCVVLNGSVAKGEAKKCSDIDLLVIAKSRRIYTCRFLTVFTIKILGLKRPKDESRNHSGKICLNYFMTEHHLVIPHDREETVNMYCARNYSYSRFLAGNPRLFVHYISCNKGWWQRFGFRVEVSEPSIKYRRGIFAEFLEWLLLGNLGDKLESYFKKIQLKKINSDPITQKFPTFIVCNDYELRFHPPKLGLRIKD